MKQVTASLNGEASWGRIVSLTSLDDDANYSLSVFNLGAGGLHLNVPGLLSVTNAGVSIASLTLSGSLAVGGALAVTGNTTLTGTLTVGGATALPSTTIGALTVTGNATVGGTLGVTGASTLSGTLTVGGATSLPATTIGSLGVTTNATVGGTLGVTGTSTLGVLNAGAATLASLAVTGATALGNDNADTLNVIGLAAFKNAASTQIQLYSDSANNRVIVGSSSPIGSDVTPNLQVIGRLYVAPESANDTAIQVRRSSAASNGWTIGVENSPVNLAFKDDSDTKVFALGDVAAPFQATVTGALSVSTSITATGGISAGASSSFTGGVSVVTGGLAILAGGLNIFAVTPTTAAAGGASALPALPAFYLPITINGTTGFKIPVYNT